MTRKEILKAAAGGTLAGIAAGIFCVVALAHFKHPASPGFYLAAFAVGFASGLRLAVIEWRARITNTGGHSRAPGHSSSRKGTWT